MVIHRLFAILLVITLPGCRPVVSPSLVFSKSNDGDALCHAWAQGWIKAANDLVLQTRYQRYIDSEAPRRGKLFFALLEEINGLYHKQPLNGLLFQELVGKPDMWKDVPDQGTVLAYFFDPGPPERRVFFVDFDPCGKLIHLGFNSESAVDLSGFKKFE